MLQICTNTRFAAEKAYAISVLLDELLGVPYSLDFRQNQEHYELKLPNGAVVVIEDHFLKNQNTENYLSTANIPQTVVTLPHPFEPDAEITGIYGRPFFQLQANNARCGIDLFASLYFMLTRWEEYVRTERDIHGRFPAQFSLAWRTGILDRPVVNEYAELLLELLRRLGWIPPFKPHKFQLHLSHDVDHPLLWQSVPARLRTLAGSLFRPGGFREAGWWLRWHIFAQQDPFDTFDLLMDMSEKNGLVSHFNFLGTQPGSADHFYNLDQPFVQNLLQKIADRGHRIGFHPSRAAYADPLVFQTELDTLRRSAPIAVTSGRQHYLCFSAPETWQRWASAGLAWDSTLGYPEAEGFRCGICCDFPVFDFLNRKTLPLREKPLIAMDVTLAQYQQYSPEKAFERLVQLRRQVEKHHGEFVLLWHNSSWNTYFWAPWQQVYREFIEL